MTSSRTHGGPDALGIAAHDFSTNSHSSGPCPFALETVRRADATRYPDASYANLRAQLAQFHGVATERIVLAASASEFIFRITAAAARGRADAAVWLLPHSYGDYATAMTAHGLHRTDDAAAACLRWACEPSSPLGAAQKGLIELLGERQKVTVLDRAYEPLRLQGRATLDATQLDTVWQLWTPNKALGLTGVRAAYAIAPLHAEALVATVEALCPSWPVGAHGVAMLQAWTLAGVQEWLATSLITLRAWKARQIDMCESLGWICLPSDANFFCAKPVLPDGPDLPRALLLLRQRGIKLRDTTSFGLPGHVRLGVLPPASQDALRAAWQSLITHNRTPL